MGDVELILVLLLVSVVVLSAAARAIHVPYPIVLVIGGAVLGLVPWLPDVRLDPDLVLVLFLPPLLYSAAFFTDLRDLRANLRVISLQAVGLVLATMVAVAWVAHGLIDGLSWPAAFALGAIVGPTDPIAGTTIARRLGVPRQMVAVIEGESLVNDASALVAYKIALAAAAGSAFSLLDAGWDFAWKAAGGIAVGIAVGWVIAEVRRRLDDPLVENTIGLLSGYAAYVPAEHLQVSAVLAAVTVGCYLGWQAPRIASPTTRLQGFGMWELLTFLLNALLFVLIGLQLPAVLDGLGSTPWPTLVGYGAAVSLAVVLTRLLWGNTVVFVIRALDRRPSQRARRVGWRLRLVGGWSGMRGAVSLAAALALPPDFAQRDLLIFLTFTVIFVTLVGQGLTLGPLIRRLDVGEDGSDDAREELKARLVATKAALARIEELRGEDWTRDDTLERLQLQFEYRKRRLAARAGKAEDDGYEDRSFAYQTILREILEAQRTEVIRLRNQGTISNDVMHRIERELDLEDERLEI
ncbi:MAG TPA: Na+/H+ antiporter [Solirubrobacter sp.]|nr:Na+/H+ antiporter [Solirubrobacter sp.]